MHNIIISFMLLCSTITYAASSDGWVIIDDKPQECVDTKFWLYDHQCAVIRMELSRRDDEGLCEDAMCAHMIFGTVRALDGRQRTIFIPPRDQVKRLMRVLQLHVRAHFAQKEGMTDQDIFQRVLAFYPMPDTALGIISPAIYKKMPCIRPGLTGFPEGYALFEKTTRAIEKRCDTVVVCTPSCMQKYHIVFNDVFHTGRTEFQIAAKILDEILPDMTQEQRAQFQIVMAAVYLQYGGEEEATVRFDGEDYSIGVVNFRGSVRDRLMMHAKLHVMNSYLIKSHRLSWNDLLFRHWLSAPEPSKKEKILSLSKEERRHALREIFENDSALEEMANDCYLAYIMPDLIYEFSVDDFVKKGWIEQESANNLQTVMPASDEKSLDLEPPLRSVYQKKSIKHFLEPVLYLLYERVLLDAPVGHTKILEACTDFPGVHDANLLALDLIANGHHRLKDNWLRACKSRMMWKKGETIGVVLCDPYVKGWERGPTECSHPHLLDDVVAGMQEGLRGNGYDVRFFHLSRNGEFCDYPRNALAYKNYPNARQKKLYSYDLVGEMTRLIWKGKGSPKDVGKYSEVRYSS